MIWFNDGNFSEKKIYKPKFPFTFCHMPYALCHNIKYLY